jgi:hypothetical protein
MANTENEKTPTGAPSGLNVGLDVKAELIVFERICTDLLSVDEKSRSRILLAVSQLLGLRM